MKSSIWQSHVIVIDVLQSLGRVVVAAVAQKTLVEIASHQRFKRLQVGELISWIFDTTARTYS
jgi:hypothetical protein